MIKTNYKVVAIDLDGTLLREDGTFSDRTKNALQDLSRAGATVLLVSGRSHRSIQVVSEKLGLNDLIISYNGAMVKSPSGETFYRQAIPLELSSKVVRFAQDNRYYLQYFTDDRLYVATRNQWSELYQRRTGIVAEPIGALLQLKSEAIKLLIADVPAEADRISIECEEAFGDQLYVTKTQLEYVEFMNSKASKGEALKFVLAKLNIPFSETIAFGDSFNDLSMMKVAGLSIAMENAVDEIKAIADRITETNQNDGVAIVIEQLLQQQN